MSDPKPKCRRLRPGLTLILFALVALEGALVLSERMRWFGVDETQRSSFTITVAAIIVSILLMFLWLLWTVVRWGFRRKFQFSLRTLLIFATLCAILCSWVAVELQQVRRQSKAVVEIRKLGGAVTYVPVFRGEGWLPLQAVPSGPAWLSRVLGDDSYLFTEPVMVNLRSVTVTDAVLQQLAYLPRLQRLDLEQSQVTDAAIEHLKGLTDLKNLDLSHTRITDAGLEHLKGLTQLEMLNLSHTQVTDAGLEHLEALTELHTLALSHAKITGSGLEDIRGLTKMSYLYLDNTEITDEGLKHLKQFPLLQMLNLDHTKVTDAGLRHLKSLKVLHQLHLADTEITDAGLERLQALSQHIELDMRRTKVTDAGVKRLRQALPYCGVQR